jgi:hypothetical protein
LDEITDTTRKIAARAHRREPRRRPAPDPVPRAGDAAERDAVTAIDREPWVRLPDGKELAAWSKDDEVRYNQRNRQAEKHLFFRRIFDFLHENEIGGDYHEYGCHRGRTFRMALTEARRHNLDGMQFWAFDSFEGLPAPIGTPSVGKWVRGALATSQDAFLALVREHGIYTANVRTIKGLYASTLTPDLQHRLLATEPRIALATIDCDLYESAVPVFNFIDPLLQPGSVLYIDDLFVGNRGDPRAGVARAFIEFRRRTRWRFLRHLDVGWWGRSYIAVEPGGTGDAIESL